ncbi:MAG: hypothetical protein MZV65_19930 [Chromatiales bacterium]|nr:hypothetical protein [Chromatiales bacterium]
MFELADTDNQSAVIKVVGVGGGGGNAVTHMVELGHRGRGLHLRQHRCAGAASTRRSRPACRSAANITKGLGAGADPEVGRQAAMEDRDRIVELIDGSDMIFITAGMGGGTGTGAAPVVAQVAQETGHPDRGGGHQAVPVRRQEAHGGRRTGHQRTEQVRRFADHHPEREAADGAGRAT